MIDKITYILQNFSAYKLGWHAKSFASIGGPSGWETISILCVATIAVFWLWNILYFIAKGEDYYSILYVPFCFLYLIVNGIFHIALACIFLSIGGLWSFITFGLVYLIVTAIWFGTSLDSHSELRGYFKLILFVLLYSRLYGRVKEYQREVNNQYASYLNIKYE